MTILQTDADSREEFGRPALIDDLKEVEIDGPQRKVKIGSALTEETARELIDLLKEFKELFAWFPSDMPGISPDVIVHELKIDPAINSIAHKRRPMGADKRIAIQQEVGRLLDAGFIKELRFQTWVANPVLVKKSYGKWRMCVDFRDLNKACPKDCYLLDHGGTPVRILTAIPAPLLHAILQEGIDRAVTQNPSPMLK